MYEVEVLVTYGTESSTRLFTDEGEKGRVGVKSSVHIFTIILSRNQNFHCGTVVLPSMRSVSLSSLLLRYLRELDVGGYVNGP
jgi:hypothetical protein